MRISWVIGSELASSSDGFYSPQASLRYRCLIPARALQARGHDVEFIRADTLRDAHQLAADTFGNIVVFTKSFHAINEAVAERARDLGRRVIVDFCDYDFATRETLRQHRAKLARRADQCVACSAPLAEIVARELSVPTPIVIDDPYELPAGMPRFAPPPDGARLMWFGNPENIRDLFAAIDGLAQADANLTLRVVTAPIDGIDDAFAAANRKFKGRLTLTFVPWSLDAMVAEVAATDIVILPTARTPIKLAKSANRAVEAIRSGRFAVAHPILAYAPLAPYIRLDDSIADGVQWALDNAREVETGLRAGQDYLEHAHSPEAIGDAWEAVILDH